MNIISSLFKFNHSRYGAIAFLLLFGLTAYSMEQVADTRFSIDRGFYIAATNLVISTDTPGSIISYTLDGSDPRTSTNIMQSIAPATVLIDPANGTGKWKATPSVIVRAYAHSSGMLPTDVDTHTYIFPSAVKSQGDLRPDGNYVFWETTEMDPEVVTDPAYAD